jgi:uncharacterized protein (TIGR04255 family)
VYPNREVFPHAPLALVAAEVRFSDAARLRQQHTRDNLVIALEQRFPVAQSIQQVNLALGDGPTDEQVQRGVALRNVGRTESLTLMSQSLTYETTQYGQFEDLLDAVTQACDALVAANVQPAIERVGLRYIDEVRVPGDVDFTDVRQWSRWIDDALIAHLFVGPAQFPATSTQIVSTYDLGDGYGLNFRGAALNQGPIVTPTHLSRAPVESGPFFALDYDGFRDFTGFDTVLLESHVVRKALLDVHVPCGTAFQRSITDEARRLFRGETS